MTATLIGDPATEAEIRFGRSRFLGGVAAFVIGLTALGKLTENTAEAVKPAPPWPCAGPSGECECCNSSGCCTKNCSVRGGCGFGAGWFQCATIPLYGCFKFFCADYYDYGDTNQWCVCSISDGYCDASFCA